MVLRNGPLCQWNALFFSKLHSPDEEALRGRPVCWTGGQLADRRDTEGQQAIHLTAAFKKPDVTGCAQLRYVRLDVG